MHFAKPISIFKKTILEKVKNSTSVCPKKHLLGSMELGNSRDEE